MRTLPPLRRLLIPVLAALLAWAAPAAAAENMAKTLLDAVTQSPAERKASPTQDVRPATAGPVAPTQPAAPVVPGAAAPQQTPLRQQTTQPRHIQPAAAPQEGLDRSILLEHDGVQRQAILRVPALPPARKGQAAPRLPAIIVLHGAGGSAEQVMRQTKIAGRATAAGFLAVFPDGLGPAEANGEGRTWNTWNCCGYARDRKIDDVGFLAALIARLTGEWRADPKRIYLAGFSNGGMLASRFALERPGAAAAIAVVAGTLPCDLESPRAGLPVLLIHGDHDNIARVGPTEAHPADGRFCHDHPARAQADFWVLGLDLAKPIVRDAAKSAVRIEDYLPAKQGGRGSLRLVIVKGGGHAWPGGTRERYRYCDLPTSGPDASGMVLEFFRREGRVCAAAQAAAKKPAAAKTPKKRAR